MFISSSRQSLMLWVMTKRPYLIIGAAVVGVVLSCIAHLQPYVGFSHVKAVGLFSEHRATANDSIDDWLRIWHISKQFLSIFVFISIFVSSISLHSCYKSFFLINMNSQKSMNSACLYLDTLIVGV